MTGSLLIIIAAVLWALDGVLRRSLYALPPITIVFVEHLVGSLFLLPIMLPSLRLFQTLKRSDKMWMVWVALFSSVLGTLWFTTALLAVKFIPFSVVFLLQKLQPVFVIVTASIFLREKIHAGYWKWAPIAIIAAYFVTFPNGAVNLSTGNGTLTAALYALAAAFAWGTSTVFSRMMLTKLPDKNVTALRFFFASILAGMLMVWMGKTDAVYSITPGQFFSFVTIALSTGMVALYIYYKGLAKTPASVSTILELVFPVTAVFIDMFVYHTSLLPSQYLAGVVLLFTAYKLGTLPKQKVSITTQKVKGKGRGKFLGFPTINLKIPAELSTQDGIYAVRVSIGKKAYKGALHYGPIPTFDDEKKSLEVFLLDAKEKDVPNTLLEKSKITVEFIQWLRPVIKFESEQALIAQMKKDVETVKGILK
jgi:drug/metabolite transporter (DMT)-like permease